MKIERQKLTEKELLEKIKEQSFWRKKDTVSYIQNAQNAEKDSERKKRLESNLCKYCYYLRGSIIAGAAITTTTCMICSKEMTFGSTATDKICSECAKNHKLCKRCISDIDYKERRKL